MPAVEVTDLTKSYGGTPALSGISMTADAGAVTAVLGPNGAGKSTTIDICSGLKQPDGGRVQILGRDPHRTHGELRPRVGVMPQSAGSSAAGVYPSARVAEVLDLYAALYADPLPATALLERLGLRGKVKTPWRELSGGEQQRLSLAMAIIGRPAVVFLDEPTAGLDVQARHITWDLIRDLRVAGVAVVLTTHAMDEAETLADAIVILDGGRVAASGTVADLLGRGVGAQTLTFHARPDLPIADLDAQLGGSSSVTEPSPGRYTVAGRIGPQTAATVTAWCAGHGEIPENLSTGRQSLEALYLELTGRSQP